MFEYFTKDPSQYGGTELQAEEWIKNIFPSIPFFKQFHWTLWPAELVEPTNQPIIVWIQGPPEEEILLYLDKFYRQIAAIIFVSNWQMQEYLKYRNIRPEVCHVISPFIFPIKEHKKPELDSINIVYFSPPDRGLSILLEAFQNIDNDNVFLHLYKNEQTTSNKNIVSHGKVSQKQMHQELEKMHIFAYPLCYTETFCISLAEAMSAGCYCLTSDRAALPETGLGLIDQYHYNDSFTKNTQEHVDTFSKKLKQAIINVQNKWDSSKQIKLTNETYSFDSVKTKWIAFAEQLQKQEREYYV